MGRHVGRRNFGLAGRALLAHWIGRVLMAVTVVATAATTALAGGTATTAGAASQPYRILAILTETGPAGAFGQGDADGLKYTIQTLNSHGGILGRKIVATIFDDGGTPVKALSILKRQLGSTKYNFIYAGSQNTTNTPMIPTIIKSGILTMTISGGTTTTGAKNPNFFYISPAQTTNTNAVCQYVLNKLKAKTVGLLDASTEAGQAALKGYEKGFQGTSTKIVAQVNITPDSVTATSQIEQVKAANPQVFIVGAFGAVAGHIAQDVAQLHYNVPIIGDLQIAASNLPSLVTPKTIKNWVIVYYASLMRKGKVSPQLQSFYSGLTKEFGTLKASMNQYTSSWDMLQLAKWAAQTTKSVTGKVDGKAIQKFSTYSSSKSVPLLTFPTYGFTPSTHSPIPTHVTQAINPYYAVGAAGSKQIAGTSRRVATIPTQPNNTSVGPST